MKIHATLFSILKRSPGALFPALCSLNFPDAKAQVTFMFLPKTDKPDVSNTDLFFHL